MRQFISLFLITFAVLLAFAWLFIFCRRRLNRTRHGLTGMCHQSGGAMCSTCGTALREQPPTCTQAQSSTSSPQGHDAA
jgi:apolipoprotein N-acyltransferase